MRGLRGHIINLSDGLGPPAGSVDVNAKLVAGGLEIDNTTHKTGTLSVIHLVGGSGSATKADQDGHFGWDMELSPGPINQLVTPHDPQTEHRKRFPDESSQVGKAFLTDLERLGWAAPHEGIIWGAVPGGHEPASAASWGTDPTQSSSWGQGNGSIAGFGSGGDAGRWTLRKFIGFLGGVVFSVEMSDLKVPVDGETVAPANGAGQDRWDLYCARMDNDPTSVNYGRQSIELTQGSPGAGIPAFPGSTSLVRRFPLHALKMVAGASVYSSATDLRRWSNPPAGVLPTGLGAGYYADGVQTVNAGVQESALNTTMASNEVVLPLSTGWDGFLVYNGMIQQKAGNGTFLVAFMVSEGRVNAGDAAVAGSNVVAPVFLAIQEPKTEVLWVPFSYTFPLLRVPSYHTDPSVSASVRSWTRLRFRLSLQGSPSAINVQRQSLVYKLWPVP